MSTTSEKDVRWYIIHTYSGQEERVKRNLDQRITSMDIKDRILQVVVPTEEEIDKHCDGGVLGDDLAVVEYAYNVSPIVAAHHFTWVGYGHDPYRISKPFDYDDPFKKPIEKW